ncbi:hypothetical protein DYB37_010986 [Aphanomyces astaci]|uniref:Uncharacterized protein n=1 Tax=Aphanomyces astaci TaxID=112090 RepID=A0A397AND7_APHAT|nr:hypothetical protein DYB36_012948 [Aphanomyces astaci]RHY70522.1 hypothetical protein DYB38_008288 [Aphanomyces astaci]RHY88365.1 hypothetical protein DYB35_008687 [Aphanomyces astaci]RHZ11055.1 hypothetical protein DYB37_010986 [Aphanomyces astaci]
MPTSPTSAVLSPKSALARLQVQWSADEKPCSPRPPPHTAASSPQLTALTSLKSDEKDAVIVYLLQKVKDQKTMQDAAIQFGEEIAAKLVLEQHERNDAYEATIHALNEALHSATHHHPEVARLEAVVLELKVQLDKEQQNVQSAVRPLYASSGL